MREEEGEKTHEVSRHTDEHSLWGERERDRGTRQVTKCYTTPTGKHYITYIPPCTDNTTSVHTLYNKNMEPTAKWELIIMLASSVV